MSEMVKQVAEAMALRLNIPGQIDRELDGNHAQLTPRQLARTAIEAIREFGDDHFRAILEIELNTPSPDADCPRCQGRGQILARLTSDQDFAYAQRGEPIPKIACPACHGSGLNTPAPASASAPARPAQPE